MDAQNNVATAMPEEANFDFGDGSDMNGFEYSAELEAQDSYFDIREQAELYRRAKEVEMYGDEVLVEYNPLEKKRV